MFLLHRVSAQYTCIFTKDPARDPARGYPILSDPTSPHRPNQTLPDPTRFYETLPHPSRPPRPHETLPDLTKPYQTLPDTTKL